MTSQDTDTPEAVSEVADTMGAVITYVAPNAKNAEADVLDRAGNALLGLVNRAARTAEADLQAAREVAEKLADQLRAAQSQINELEASVRYYQDRTEHAEKWLNQISSKIQQSFLGGDDSHGARQMAERLQNQDKIGAKPRPGRREPVTPSFLGRLRNH
jgi:chromosome segregation ATPase